jgi:hypothetical protein
MTTHIDKIETDEYRVDLITLKDGRVLGISDDCVVLYENMQDYIDNITKSRQCIDLYGE